MAINIGVVYEGQLLGCGACLGIVGKIARMAFVILKANTSPLAHWSLALMTTPVLT